MTLHLNHLHPLLSHFSESSKDAESGYRRDHLREVSRQTRINFLSLPQIKEITWLQGVFEGFYHIVQGY